MRPATIIRSLNGLGLAIIAALIVVVCLELGLDAETLALRQRLDEAASISTVYLVSGGILGVGLIASVIGIFWFQPWARWVYAVTYFSAFGLDLSSPVVSSGIESGLAMLCSTVSGMLIFAMFSRDYRELFTRLPPGQP